jgi:hypothetical protein
MQQRLVGLRLVLPLVLFLGMACGPCGLLAGDQPTPPRPIAVSTESAGQLESRIQQNLTGEPGQQFILQMADGEITSLVATKLAQNDDSPVKDPQIWFTKGKIYGTGKLVNVLPVTTPFYMVATARVEDGKVVVAMEETSAGAVPIPARLLSTISQSINETVEELQLDVEITALEILEGELIVKGMRN